MSGKKKDEITQKADLVNSVYFTACLTVQVQKLFAVA